MEANNRPEGGSQLTFAANVPNVRQWVIFCEQFAKRSQNVSSASTETVPGN